MVHGLWKIVLKGQHLLSALIFSSLNLISTWSQPKFDPVHKWSVVSECGNVARLMTRLRADAAVNWFAGRPNFRVGFKSPSSQCSVLRSQILDTNHLSSTSCTWDLVRIAGSWILVVLPRWPEKLLCLSPSSLTMGGNKKSACRDLNMDYSNSHTFDAWVGDGWAPVSICRSDNLEFCNSLPRSRLK